MSLEFELYVTDPDTPGGWFPLQTDDRRMYLSQETFANRTQTLKRVTAANVFIPGTYTVRATPDNTTETVGIYVTESNTATREGLLDRLIALFSRPQFTMMKVEDETTQLLYCQASDYVMNIQKEFRHAGMVLLTFSVPVLPHKENSVIGTVLANGLLDMIFVNANSPFIINGFEASLHVSAAVDAGANEVVSPSYTRARIGCGASFWVVNMRSAYNLVDIVFPALADEEYIRGIRTMVLWDAGSNTPMFTTTIDDPGFDLSPGNRLVVPAGGLVYGFE